MAISTEDYQPDNRNVDVTLGEWQTGHIIGDGTVVCFVGNGELGDFINNVAVAGTVQFFDAATAAAAAAANRIALYDTMALGPLKKAGPFRVRRGLVVTSSAATNDFSFQLRGRPTVAAYTFGQ